VLVVVISCSSAWFRNLIHFLSQLARSKSAQRIWQSYLRASREAKLAREVQSRCFFLTGNRLPHPRQRPATHPERAAMQRAVPPWLMQEGVFNFGSVEITGRHVDRG
jgi:hypothetical protein